MTASASPRECIRGRSTTRLLSICGLILAVLAGESLAADEGQRRAPNRLSTESSPYLRLHADNPVDWYPWGAEALAKAREEEKPIFLSIGYTACYWCHVMEREVFSNQDIAELMNRWFVNIKVDREERPDLDEIYMTATQIITGSGGWPNSVFLTPDLEPFYAGTYFPPEDREGRRGFVTVLKTLDRAWSESRDEVVARARKIAATVRTSMSSKSAESAAPPVDAALKVVAAVKDQFDSDFGGFGQAPKFPNVANLALLWERAERGDREAETIVVETLSAMGRGAIFDHLDGGFHRYTLDREWRKPHFEKMLYDNALLAELLVVVAADQGDPFLERLARATLDFLLETMRRPNGAFIAAIDAQTDGIEGAFYLWTRDQIEATIDSRALELVAPIYGLDQEPVFDRRHYALYLTAPYALHAARLDLTVPELVARIDPILNRLATKRRLRLFPNIDDKVLCDWNGMAVSALARAAQRSGRADYLEAAVKAASFLLALRDDEGIQLHVWRLGTAKIPAFLDDYAFLIRSLLTLYEVTNEARWLREAQRLTEQADARLTAPGGAYFAAGSDPHLLVRSATAWDDSIPAANGVMVSNLLRLADWTGRESYRHRARDLLSVFGGDLQRVPAATATLALGALRLADHTDGVPGPLANEARDVVRASIVAQAAGESGWHEFALTLAIREGWHINANPASVEFLVPTEVTGSVRRVRYPQGKVIEVAFAETGLAVFESEVVIRGEAELGEPIRLRYQACDERRCLPPVSLELEPTPASP